MALIKCPDCKSSISDSAATCPHCGCDYQRILREIEHLKKDIHSYETLKKPKPVSHFNGLSILLYLIAGACVLGACLIKTLAPIFLLVGGIFPAVEYFGFNQRRRKKGYRSIHGKVSRG